MKTIRIISPGRKHSPEMAELVAEYEKRLTGRFDIDWKFISPGTVAEEGEAILKSLNEGDYVILLDERGKQYSSPNFSKLLDSAVASYKRIVFIIGGDYGVTPEVAARAKATVSLSPMVFPHAIVRLILIEQIYRATEISRGGQYHHA